MNKLKSIISRYWPILVLVILVGIFFWKVFLKRMLPIPGDIVIGLYFPWLDYKWGYLVGVPVKNNLISDVVSVMYPFKNYAVNVLRSGSFPLWNPFSFCGAPLFANFQSNILHPLMGLFLLLPFKISWSIQVVFQPFLAGIFTYLFLRSLGVRKSASMFGSIIYAFSGFSIIWLEYNIHGYVAAFIPLILYFVNRYFDDAKWGFGVSIALALQVFSGYPQLVFYTLILVGGYFIFGLIYFNKKRGLIKNTFIIIMFILLGLSLAAIQIIPGIELLQLSQRTKEGIPGGVSIAFMPWQYLLTFFIPDFFGNPATNNFWFVGDYTNTVTYSGIVSLIFAVIAVIRSQNIQKKFWLLVVAVIFLYVLPTPLSYLLRNTLPFLFGAAATTRAIVFINFAIAILAALGFQYFYEESKRSDHKIPLYLLIVLLGILGELLIIKELFLKVANELVGRPEGLAIITTWINNVSTSIRNTLLPITIVFLVLILMLVRSIVPKTKIITVLLLIILTIGELFRFGWKFTPFVKQELVFPSTPVLNYLKSQPKPFRMVAGNVIPMNMWAVYQLESPAGYDAVYPLRSGKYIQYLNNDGYSENVVSRFSDIKRFDSPLFDLTNTKYVLGLKYNEKGNVATDGKLLLNFQIAKFVPVFEDKSVIVLENKSALPRAFMVYKYEVETEDKKIIQTLLKPKFPIRDDIVLEEQLPRVLSSGQVNDISYEGQINGDSVIRVKQEGLGLLFVSDSYYPGWKAFIDGKETKIYRADFLFRAVLVPPGEHRIQFIYRPESFRIGIAISLLSLVLMGGIIIYDRKNKSSY